MKQPLRKGQKETITTIMKAIKRLLFGTPIKGEPATTKRKSVSTTMPDSNITLLQWYRGEWSRYINHKKPYE